jgi:hypothetical protein
MAKTAKPASLILEEARDSVIANVLLLGAEPEPARSP